MCRIGNNPPCFTLTSLITASKSGTFVPGRFLMLNQSKEGTRDRTVVTRVYKLGGPAGSPGIPLIFGRASSIHRGSAPPLNMSGTTVRKPSLANASGNYRMNRFNYRGWGLQARRCRLASYRQNGHKLVGYPHNFFCNMKTEI